MRQARRPAGRPGRHHRRRLVALSATLENSKAYREWEYWESGLYGAKMLRQHFPKFFKQHVASRPCTIQLLAAASACFLCLADRHLVELVGWGMWQGADPQRLFIERLEQSEEAALGDLEDDIQSSLHNPSPVLYGWERDFEEHNTADHFKFLLSGMWRLVEGTRWAIVDVMPEQYLRRHIGATQALILEEVKPLPPVDDMDALVAALNKRPLAGVEKLGDILAYACSQTGCNAADYSNAEMEEGGYVTFDLVWSDLKKVQWYHDDQLRGQEYFHTFEQFAKRLKTEPWLLEKVARSMRRKALALRRQEADARQHRRNTPLIEQLKAEGALDEAQADEGPAEAEAEALAAPARAREAVPA